MNIAIFADVHGRILLCFKLCARWEKETGQRIDLILQAGDLGAFPDETRLDKATRRFAQADPTELGFLTDFVHYDPATAALLNETTCNLLFVRGNHEDHSWLDQHEQAATDTIFPIDAYKRIYCLKSGIPYTFQANDQQIQLLGIGRVGALAGEQNVQQAKYIQDYETERIFALGKTTIDVLLTHDSPQHFITPGYGMEEIRLVLNQYRPTYHFFGHCGGPCKLGVDSNQHTISCKLADLHWTSTKMWQHNSPGILRWKNLLQDGSMGILRWENQQEHTFEVVDAPWLKEYTAYSWRSI